MTALGRALATGEYTIYGYHMPDSTKTTVYLDAEDYRRLKALAQAQGGSAAELVREAVAEYVRTHVEELPASSIGVGRSGRGDVSSKAESLLKKGFGRPR